MRVALLIAVVACGNAERSQLDPPAPTVDQPVVAAPKPPCKPGTTTCRGDDVMMCEDATSRKTASCRGGCKQGACVETCGANDVELIYVVDADRSTLLSFDPKKLPADPFRPIGPLSCEGSSQPNSMAVDRTGIAWLNYANGSLHQASVIDGHCFSQAAPPEGAPSRRFCMGFVTDGPKATSEKLYVVEYGAGSQFATIDTRTFPTRWVSQGKLAAPRAYPPELTGTSEGRLYGYFPTETSRGYVQELDRKGAAIGRRWSLPATTGHVGAWAFAFWGDVFYVFVNFDGTNEVHAIHRKTGKHELVVKSSAHRIVGAGVSTCAPLLEKPL
jgi:hypothetical protein